MSIQCAIAAELNEDGVEGLKPFDLLAERADTSDHVVTLVGAGLVSIIVVFLVATSPSRLLPSPPATVNLAVSRTPGVAINVNTTPDGPLNSIEAAPAVTARIMVPKTKAPSQHRPRDAMSDARDINPNGPGAFVDSNAPAELATLRELQSKM